MKKTYVVPKSVAIYAELEMGLLYVSGDDDPIHEHVMEPDDRGYYDRFGQ